MHYGIAAFIVLFVVLTAVLMIDEHRWQKKFCKCCLRRKAECNCGSGCQRCLAKLQPFRDALARDSAEYRESPEYKSTQP